METSYKITGYWINCWYCGGLGIQACKDCEDCFKRCEHCKGLAKVWQPTPTPNTYPIYPNPVYPNPNTWISNVVAV